MDMTKVEERAVETIHAMVGEVRRFGAGGPPYAVIGPGAISAGSEAMLETHIIETGEEADYPLRDLLDDPLADQSLSRYADA